MPAVAGSANDRSWGNHDRRSWGNDNWRARGNDDRTIRAAPSELVAMKARPTATLRSGAIDPGRTNVPLPWRSHRCCPTLE
jgi:hypothetical protein